MTLFHRRQRRARNTQFFTSKNLAETCCLLSILRVKTLFVVYSSWLYPFLSQAQCCESHVICRLKIHLENQQQVFFEPGLEQEALERAEEKDTHLTAWFRLNREDPRAHDILYKDRSNSLKRNIIHTR